ncbi:HINT domain-containing protein [Streptomyces odontomachi]|uniref:HINT domain-containing protein n=1 Tax=Streptomyces odontomachi TaxID=2944940 RepID=UPI00210C0164|nr:HINT domain-containing protein [Streptomyces sp. ODS25]
MVTAVHINRDNDLVDLTIRDSHGRTATLHTTFRHPFWDDSTHVDPRRKAAPRSCAQHGRRQPRMDDLAKRQGRRG